MDARLAGITEGYRERIQRIALFDPLYHLEAKREKDRQDRKIDFFGLGLMTLLFFFENMLMRNKKIDVRELANYLQQVNQDEIDMDPNWFEKVARQLVDTFRPPHGKRNAKEFYNWETRQFEKVEYSILKAERADLESNKQFYSLDEHGLELVFATKEFFREFHLSINQLLLRKQLEKGEFVGALRQIDEMRVDVESLQQRIVKIKHEVQRNIISEETFLRYQVVIEDINARLNREQEEFQELRSFVRETRERMGYELVDAKEQRAYAYIVRIDGELEEVHSEHTELLRDSIQLKTTALKAAQEALYYVAVQSFNFDQELTARLFSTPLPVSVARTMIEPFLQLEHQTAWSPLAVFEPQRIGRESDSDETDEFEDIRDEAAEQYGAIQRENFGMLLQLVLALMGSESSITLGEIVRQIRYSEQGGMLMNRSFYDFWLLLHQRSPFVQEQASEQSTLYQHIYQILHEHQIRLSVTELPELIRVNERFVIQDFEVHKESVTHEI